MAVTTFVLVLVLLPWVVSPWDIAPGVFVVIALMSAAAAKYVMLARRADLPPGFCVKCGYDRRGLGGARCPECGGGRRT